MFSRIREHLRNELEQIRKAGLYKNERLITTPQNAKIKVGQQRSVLNFCANNYLGLAQHPEILPAAREGLERPGYRPASVRFICGTQSLHKQLEQQIPDCLC